MDRYEALQERILKVKGVEWVRAQAKAFRRRSGASVGRPKTRTTAELLTTAWRVILVSCCREEPDHPHFQPTISTAEAAKGLSRGRST
jgi:hypothetical protein